MHFVFPNVDQTSRSVLAVRIGPTGPSHLRLPHGVAASMGLDQVSSIYAALLGKLPLESYTKGYVAQPRPDKVIAHSAQFAALLALVHDTHPFASIVPGLRRHEVVWATGELISDGENIYLGEATPIQEKVEAFARLNEGHDEQECARYFLVPRVSVERITLEVSLDRMHLIDFLARCRDPANLHSKTRSLVLLEPRDLFELTRFLSGQPRSRTPIGSLKMVSSGLDVSPNLRPYGAGVVSCASILAALLGFRNRAMAGTGAYPYWAIPALLLASGFTMAAFHWRRRNRLRSHLTRPEAFNLRASGDQVVGRHEDAERLIRVLDEARLVWLVGESGVGKSTLLSRVVVPVLRQQHPKLVPIWLGTLGADWLIGPQESLRDALQACLSDDDRVKLGLGAQVHTDEAVGILGRFRQVTGRVPLLFFDQFDDYALKHRDRLLMPDGLITPDKISASHLFWRSIAMGLSGDADSIRCVFSSRDDLSYLLGAFRFVEPRTVPLFRLKLGYTGPLIDRLAEGAVANPEGGFGELRARLAKDLECNGDVLPIQLRLALSGLPRLGELTEEEYQRKGGLPGLETVGIAYWLRAAIVRSAIDQHSAYATLLTMIDPDRQKAISATEADLCAALPANQRGALPEFISVLEEGEIVRRTLDNTRSTAVSWTLDHDYLCRGVLSISQQERHWDQRLAAAAEAFRRAPSISQRWSALLAPGLQLRLWWQRVRGNVRFGPHRGFILLSVLRWVVNSWLAAVAITALATSAAYRQAKADAALQLSAARTFGEIDTRRAGLLDGNSLPALRMISRASYVFRREVLGQIFRRTSNLERFFRVHDALVHATAGLDLEARDRLTEDVLRPNCYVRHTGRLQSAACLLLAMDLGDRSEGADDLTRRALEWPGDEAPSTNESVDFGLASALRSAGASCLPGNLARLYTIAREGLESENPSTRYLASEWLRGAAPRLTTAQADDVARVVIQTGRVDMGVIAGLCSRLSPEAAAELFGIFLSLPFAQIEASAPEYLLAVHALYQRAPAVSRATFRSSWLSRRQGITPTEDTDLAVRVFEGDLSPSEWRSLAETIFNNIRTTALSPTEHAQAAFHAANRTLQRLVAASGPNPARCRELVAQFSRQMAPDVVVPYGLLDCVANYPNDDVIVRWMVEMLDGAHLLPAHLSSLLGARFELRPESMATVRLGEWVRAHVGPDNNPALRIRALAFEGELGCPGGLRSTQLTAEQWSHGLASGSVACSIAPGCQDWRLSQQQLSVLLPNQLRQSALGDLAPDSLSCMLPVLSPDAIERVVASQLVAGSATPLGSPQIFSGGDTDRFHRFCTSAARSARERIHGLIGPRLAANHPLGELEMSYAICTSSALTDAETEALADRLVQTLTDFWHRFPMDVPPVPPDSNWSRQAFWFVHSASASHIRTVISRLAALLNDQSESTRIASLELLRLLASNLEPGPERDAAADALWRYLFESGQQDATVALAELRLAGVPINRDHWHRITGSATLSRSLADSLSYPNVDFALVDGFASELFPLLVSANVDIRSSLLVSLMSQLGAGNRVPDCGMLRKFLTPSDLVHVREGLALSGCPRESRVALARYAGQHLTHGANGSYDGRESEQDGFVVPSWAVIRLRSPFEFSVDLAREERGRYRSEVLGSFDWWDFVRRLHQPSEPASPTR